MSDDKGQGRDAKRVNPADDQELSDEVLESVAGGCQQGCSDATTCFQAMSLDTQYILPAVPN